ADRGEHRLASPGDQLAGEHPGDAAYRGLAGEAGYLGRVGVHLDARQQGEGLTRLVRAACPHTKVTAAGTSRLERELQDPADDGDTPVGRGELRLREQQRADHHREREQHAARPGDIALPRWLSLCSV